VGWWLTAHCAGDRPCSVIEVLVTVAPPCWFIAPVAGDIHLIRGALRQDRTDHRARSGRNEFPSAWPTM
jgi:hypothetical protein